MSKPETVTVRFLCVAEIQVPTYFLDPVDIAQDRFDLYRDYAAGHYLHASVKIVRVRRKEPALATMDFETGTTVNPT